MNFSCFLCGNLIDPQCVCKNCKVDYYCFIIHNLHIEIYDELDNNYYPTIIKALFNIELQPLFAELTSYRQELNLEKTNIILKKLQMYNIFK